MRRSRAQAEQAELQSAAEARAAQTIAEAEAKATRLVADALTEVRRLHGLREETHTQLDALQQRLLAALTESRAVIPAEPELSRPDGSTPA
jgi:regulator of protease activity HflC (stomatin/prohibitin superfamily)